MSILKIARMGHPVLRKVAKRVENPNDPEIIRLIADMIETLKDAGGVGLAAPQVFQSVAVMIFFVPPSRTTEDDAESEVPLTVLINPEIEPLEDDEKVGGWEGCLSIPGFQGFVPRWGKIRYRGIDQNGDRVEKTASGFHARVVQHEYDHLIGVMYPERMEDMTLMGFTEELRRDPPDVSSDTSDADRRDDGDAQQEE
ncbi:peptide deformylase [Thalassospira mesophila]|uniref:Peptide deformylase n=1 Tax=Thalassospira mesophila TaxID=1293891 RepID=A0A1Y2KZU3_9PROT|nr:peptide deformylase [Thalassospira mesophila]OSQ38262.1 peptide deformylase [Thalassospira mesophila]